MYSNHRATHGERERGERRREGEKERVVYSNHRATHGERGERERERGERRVLQP